MPHLIWKRDRGYYAVWMSVPGREHFMEYSASGVKYLLWFVETRETARLLKDHSEEEVREMVLNENVYQQKDRRRVMLFELMYEVYRTKIHLGEEEWIDADLNIFFGRKADQSELIAGWTEATIKKLKQVYTRCLLEAGMLKKESAKTKKITKPYIDPEFRQILLDESMDDYLYALTGEK